MCITTVKGSRYSGDDMIIMYHGKPTSLYHIAKILLLLWDNEDRKNPAPRLGAKYTMNFLQELFEKRELTDELMLKYKIQKPKS